MEHSPQAHGCLGTSTAPGHAFTRPLRHQVFSQELARRTHFTAFAVVSIQDNLTKKICPACWDLGREGERDLPGWALQPVGLDINIYVPLWEVRPQCPLSPMGLSSWGFPDLSLVWPLLGLVSILLVCWLFPGCSLITKAGQLILPPTPGFFFHSTIAS